MTQRELQECDYKRTEYLRMRNMLLTISLIFLTAALGLSATQIGMVSVNRQMIEDHEVRIRDVELYKTSVYQFSDLVRSIMIYTNHMTSLVAGDQEDVMRWQKEYEQLWREINFRSTGLLDRETRSGVDDTSKEE